MCSLEIMFCVITCNDFYVPGVMNTIYGTADANCKTSVELIRIVLEFTSEGVKKNIANIA